MTMSSRDDQLNFQSVPDWEKRFCQKVGQVPWRKLVETKEYMSSMYKRIVEWNDSAGEEAFKEAKSRFWAEINGLRHDVPLAGRPDLYVDEIDWDDTSCDIDMILDLERSKIPNPDYKPLDRGDREVVIIGLDSLLSGQSNCWGGTGWGEEFGDEDFLKNQENNVAENNKGNPWESAWGNWESYNNGNYGGGDCRGNFRWDSNANSRKYSAGCRNNNNSRYKIPGCHGNDNYKFGYWRRKRPVNVGY